MAEIERLVPPISKRCLSPTLLSSNGFRFSSDLAEFSQHVAEASHHKSAEVAESQLHVSQRANAVVSFPGIR